MNTYHNTFRQILNIILELTSEQDPDIRYDNAFQKLQKIIDTGSSPDTVTEIFSYAMDTHITAKNATDINDKYLLRKSAVIYLLMALEHAITIKYKKPKVS